jgi:hypothetical protein
MRSTTLSSVALAAFLLGSLAGCGSTPTAHIAATVPAKGKVTYKGKPLTKGSITFEPEAGREAHGEIKPDGTFVLSTFKEGDGAVPGIHRVSVSLTDRTVPAKFKNASSSGCTVTVEEGKSEYNISFD